MALLQGSSYYLPIKITDQEGKVVTGEMVQKSTFTIGDIIKEGTYNAETKMWEVPLSEEETFGLSNEVIEWQARFLFVDRTTDGTKPKGEYVYRSVNKVLLSGGEDNA